MKEEIVGIDRVLQNRQKGLKWNNKKIKWSIAHNTQNQSKHYDIELQMVFISSKRIVKVNEQVKDMRMCSFGYEANFDISKYLKGCIKQDGLCFQLYVNGSSFTKLQQNNKTYQPPKLSGSTNDSLQFNVRPKKQNENELKEIIFQSIKKLNQNQKTKHNFQQNEGSKNSQKFKREHQKQGKNINLAKSMQYKEQNNLKQITFKLKATSSGVEQTKKSTENTIKDAQSQLMKILMQQKRKRKHQVQERKNN